MCMRSPFSPLSIRSIMARVPMACIIWLETWRSGYKTGLDLTTMPICRNAIRQAPPLAGTRASVVDHGKVLGSCSEPPRGAAHLPINVLRQSGSVAHDHRSRVPTSGPSAWTGDECSAHDRRRLSMKIERCL
jgi:hypothetical protein